MKNEKYKVANTGKGMNNAQCSILNVQCSLEVVCSDE
jgi:hypothetical protein